MTIFQNNSNRRRSFDFYVEKLFHVLINMGKGVEILKEWRKLGVLAAAASMLLAGCTGEAKPVRDAIVQSMDKPNYEFLGTIKMTGDLDKLAQDAGADQKAISLLDTLKAGVTITGAQSDINHGRLVVRANNDQILRDNHLYSGGPLASLEAVNDGNDIYVTSPLDNKYLKLDAQGNNVPEGLKIDPAKIKEWQNQINKLTVDFMKVYISKYGYKLSHAKNLGYETVQLPNGQKVMATHIGITLDEKELVDMLLYTAKDITHSQDVRKFAIDYLTLINQIIKESGNPQAKTLTGEEIQQMVDQGMALAKQRVEQMEQTYTVDQLVAMGKQNGLENVTMKLDYYIDNNKVAVHNLTSLQVTAKNPADQTPPVTVGILSDGYVWNVGGVPAITPPSADRVVTIEQLQKDPKGIQLFNPQGILYTLAKASVGQQTKEIAQK